MTLEGRDGKIPRGKKSLPKRVSRADLSVLGLHLTEDKKKVPLKVAQDLTKADSQKARFNALIIRVADQQDKSAFAELFAHFAPRVKSYALRGGVSDTAAEEIAQETLLMVWRKAALFDCRKAAASTWIFTIARNKRIDYQRRKNKPVLKEEDFLHLAEDEKTQDDQYEVDQASSAVTNALSGLPEDQRIVIEKAFMEDKSHAVVAEELGLPLGTVKSRIRIALKKLRGGLSVFE